MRFVERVAAQTVVAPSESDVASFPGPRWFCIAQPCTFGKMPGPSISVNVAVGGYTADQCGVLGKSISIVEIGRAHV